jgi:hypothetical protein
LKEKFNTKKKYRKEYLKQLVIDGKLSIGLFLISRFKNKGKI